MAGFTVETFDLSMTNIETGNPYTANIYRVEGIQRDLSIGELVMAICLQQATAVEDQIVDLMNVMAATTKNIETMTAIEKLLGDCQVEGIEKMTDITDDMVKKANITLVWYDSNGQATGTAKQATTWADISNFLVSTVGMNATSLSSATKLSETLQLVATQLDTLNTTNQKQMIELQSQTNKRDQRYELITNALKSFNTQLTTNARNLGA